MWYVIQVRTGTEESIRAQCDRNVSTAVLERCFIPYYEERKRIRGTWTTQKKVLFPGYVFLISEKLEELYESLKRIIGLTKLIGAGDEILPLKDSEVSLLKRLGGEEQVVGMSEGMIEDSQVRIMSGPLMGMEGYIRKIDRHKRKAWIEVEMFGRLQRVEVGVEIKVKTVETD